MFSKNYTQTIKGNILNVKNWKYNNIIINNINNYQLFMQIILYNALIVILIKNLSYFDKDA